MVRGLAGSKSGWMAASLSCEGMGRSAQSAARVGRSALRRMTMARGSNILWSGLWPYPPWPLTMAMLTPPACGRGNVGRTTGGRPPAAIGHWPPSPAVLERRFARKKKGWRFRVWDPPRWREARESHSVITPLILRKIMTVGKLFSDSHVFRRSGEIFRRSFFSEGHYFPTIR